MNQNLYLRQLEAIPLILLRDTVEDALRLRREWEQARAKAIDAWIAFMMPKLYREQHELTEEMARLFAEMCLTEGRIL